MNNKELLRGLGQAREAGLVKSQKHPTLDLYIYNYTPTATFTPAAFEDPFVRLARGLILDGRGNIEARAFEKFFNYGDPQTGPLDLEAPVSVYDKVDGSLGILYRDDDRWSVATRGSFTSDQAMHASEVWADKYEGEWAPLRGHTALFEIVYPENRIVLDYGDLDDLVLLGLVNNKTGEFTHPETVNWPGPIVEALPHTTLREALEAEPRPNREGFVVYFPDTLVKIKQEDYLVLHKAIFGLNERTVWETLASGQTLESLLEKLPDEFHEWTKNIAHDLLVRHTKRDTAAGLWFNYILRGLDYDLKHQPREARKEFAAQATQQTAVPASWLFSLLDGKDISDTIWQSLRPKNPVGPFSGSDSRIEEG